MGTKLAAQPPTRTDAEVTAVDADTEVFQRITIIEGFVDTLVLLVDSEEAPEPTWLAMAERIGECTRRAKSAIVRMRPEHEIRDRVRELADAASQAVDWCRSAGLAAKPPCGLSEQILRDALDLEHELGDRQEPLG
jgi:hypothetical protein